MDLTPGGPRLTYRQCPPGEVGRSRQRPGQFRSVPSKILSALPSCHRGRSIGSLARRSPRRDCGGCPQERVDFERSGVVTGRHPYDGTTAESLQNPPRIYVQIPSPHRDPGLFVHLCGGVGINRVKF